MSVTGNRWQALSVILQKDRPHFSAEPNGSSCLLVKQADTAFWLCWGLSTTLFLVNQFYFEGVIIEKKMKSVFKGHPCSETRRARVNNNVRRVEICPNEIK